MGARDQLQTSANTWRRAPHSSEAVGGVGGVCVMKLSQGY